MAEFFLGATTALIGSRIIGRLRARGQPVVYTYNLQACRLCGCRSVSRQEAAAMGLAQALPVETVYPSTMVRRPYGLRPQYGYRYYDGYIPTPAYIYRGRRVRPFY